MIKQNDLKVTTGRKELLETEHGCHILNTKEVRLGTVVVAKLVHGIQGEIYLGSYGMRKFKSEDAAIKGVVERLNGRGHYSYLLV